MIFTSIKRFVSLLNYSIVWEANTTSSERETTFSRHVIYLKTIPTDEQFSITVNFLRCTGAESKDSCSGHNVNRATTTFQGANCNTLGAGDYPYQKYGLHVCLFSSRAYFHSYTEKKYSDQRGKMALTEIVHWFQRERGAIVQLQRKWEKFEKPDDYCGKEMLKIQSLLTSYWPCALQTHNLSWTPNGAMQTHGTH